MLCCFADYKQVQSNIRRSDWCQSWRSYGVWPCSWKVRVIILLIRKWETADHHWNRPCKPSSQKFYVDGLSNSITSSSNLSILPMNTRSRYFLIAHLVESFFYSMSKNRFSAVVPNLPTTALFLGRAIHYSERVSEILKFGTYCLGNSPQQARSRGMGFGSRGPSSAPLHRAVSKTFTLAGSGRAP